MNKNITIKLLLSALVLGTVSCQEELPEFEVDAETIVQEAVGADGGVRTFQVSAPGKWVAKTQAPWITVSPANGNGPAECKVIIDSSLSDELRKATVRIEAIGSSDRQDFEVSQEGYPVMLAMKDNEMKIKSIDEYEKRTFDIRVKANVNFDVVIPEQDKKWLEYEIMDNVEERLDRDLRPRDIRVRFRWGINFTTAERESVIQFKKISRPDKELKVKDDFILTQEKAAEIEAGTPKGDRDAILAILNSLNSSMQINTAEKLENWDNVTVWTEGEDKGRVRSVRFEMFSTKEPIPYQVKYLTACEEMVFYSNSNSFLYNLSTGEHLAELGTREDPLTHEIIESRLKRLTIGAYGLTELDPSFKTLDQLEYLNLEGNNFQEIPEMLLDPQNFPHLHALMIHANQRNTIQDLSNTVRKNYGGLENSSIEETLPAPLPGKNPKYKLSFPRRLLEMDKLDTLRLSVNYLQGSIPAMDEPDVPKWTLEEVQASDTLSMKLVGLPKVLPHLNYFAINLNRLSGELPQWLLYHPKLDLWAPFSLVFPQDGKDKNGEPAKFTNAWPNLDEYYKAYPNKKYNPKNQIEEE